MRFWIQFLREKRTAILLYLGTILLLLMTGSLSHVENFEKLLYGALLSLVLWAVVFVIQGLPYVKKCRRLETIREQLEQHGASVLGEILNQSKNLTEGEEDEGKIGEHGTEEPGLAEQGIEQQLEQLFYLAGDCFKKSQLAQEEKEAERRDYYLMWTHQIKTPISALKLLLEKNPDCKDGFLMREELFKIEQYVEMVLTFQRLDSMGSDLVLQEYELVPLVKQAVRKYAVLFINKGLRVEVPDSQVKILTDQKWFSFCLEQLLSNSIKYTEKGGISFVITEDEKTVTLTVADTGMGIRPEDLPRIFERGFTGYNGRLDKKSTGIGLYLCKQVFEKLGIAIRAESKIGEGTEMSIRILKPYKNVRLEEKL